VSNYLICDTSNRVAGERFIAVPPAVQAILAVPILHGAEVEIDGVPTKVFALGYSKQTLKSDVLVEDKGKLVTMKY